MSRFRVLIVVAAAALGVGAAQPAVSQQQLAPLPRDVAPPIGVEPTHLELSTPLAPLQMRAEDAQRLLEQLGVPATAPAPVVAPALTPASSGGVSRTISINAPAIVNRSSQFMFKDVTERRESSSPTLAPAQRHAAVEAYRQSLAKAKAAGR